MSDHRLFMEKTAAATLRAELLKIDGITEADTDLIADTIEGETRLTEEIAKAIDRMDEDQIMVDGIAARIAELTARKQRHEDRIEATRGLIEQSLAICDVQKLTLPAATLTRKALPRVAEITDESDIPSQFYEAQAPRLNKAALSRALREAADELDAAQERHDAGEITLDELTAIRAEMSIPGATLGTPKYSLQIRRK